MTTYQDRVLFGAAYYHEYQPTPRLERDLDLMQAAHFSVIRVGESVWSTWEPENGVFDLDWLLPVLDGAHARGISVILGTPTYAAPPWLARLYPEINVDRRTGAPMGWGVRQEIDYTHPAFLFHAERIIRKIMERYANHPAVIGFQVDNEPGNEIFYNRGVFQQFTDALRQQYGTVEALNEEWGLTYWSHRLSTWADLWTPDANAQPQYALAWRRFQAQLTTSFISWQAGIVREYSNDEQFVTTCISYERPAVQDEELTKHLDVTAGNPYYRMQDQLALPATSDGNQSWTTSGTWSLYATADRMFASKQSPFLVTETNAQAIGMPWNNEPAFDGQWRQTAWALVSRGATMIEYWHWHTLHFGAETYWGGVLPHSGEPGRVYAEVARIGAEFAAAGELVASLTPDSDVAIIYSNDSKWALSEFPQLNHDGEPDRRSFQSIFDSFYQGAFDAGLQTRIIHGSQLTESYEPAVFAAAHPVLVAAGFSITSNKQLEWLENYADAGGHLIVGIRTGYEDHEARARTDRKPAILSDAAGVWYDEFSTINTTLPVVSAGEAILEGHATRYIDGLQNLDARVLATYKHPHFERWPAITTRPHGNGRVSYVGTVPDAALAKSFMTWAVNKSSQPAAKDWSPATDSQTSSSATSANGTKIRFIHNWSWEPSTFTVPVKVRDLVSAETFEPGEELSLQAWDVRIVAEV
ncbi:beta-galactosidase [Arthrobacter alpinus]|uniref:beta-galactosidase n=1 Tax=Arthrobacter alpinus TaxID=656366 RepID=UPI0005C95EA5|nr:beta-galactosidase [Arthrobacter alpinus]ALV45158.1 beta-galactosidase [Arthrobacter alpinus]